MNRSRLRCVGLISFILMILTATPDATARAEGEEKKEPPLIIIKVPIDSKEFSNLPVAIVEDEKITVGDLWDFIKASDKDRDSEVNKEKINYGEILDRLITTKLIVRESINMGLDELPEVKKLIDVYELDTLINELQNEITKDVKADEKQVDIIYREMVKRWRIRSISFQKEEDAKRVEEAIKKGEDFDRACSIARSEGALLSEEEDIVVKPGDLQPRVASVISTMKPGEVSEIIKLEYKQAPRYVIVKLEEVQYPDDLRAREEAKQKVLNKKKVEVLTKYNERLSKKYVRIDRRLFQSLNYNVSEDQIEKMAKDKRVIAYIGRYKITVGDFTNALKKRFFHGMDRAAREGKITLAKRISLLEEMIGRKLFELEAKRRRIDKRDEYIKKVNRYKEFVLFDTFIKKVIVPEIKISEEELKEYYEKHSSEYTLPKMLKLDSIVLNNKDAAVEVFEKIKKGYEFNWLKENTEGQIKKGSKDLLIFPESPVLESELPESLRSILSGGRVGDARLYSSPEGYHYIIYIRDVFPERLQRFEDVADDILNKLVALKAKKAIDEWGETLREQMNVKIYLYKERPSSVIN